jgi:hypothetical protein
MLESPDPAVEIWRVGIYHHSMQLESTRSEAIRLQLHDACSPLDRFSPALRHTQDNVQTNHRMRDRQSPEQSRGWNLSEAKQEKVTHWREGVILSGTMLTNKALHKLTPSTKLQRWANNHLSAMRRTRPGRFCAALEGSVAPAPWR